MTRRNQVGLSGAADAVKPVLGLQVFVLLR